ncbi:GTPase [Enterovibrio norvegicus]|uniref:GTPase n=1 Tax=Enterovibrio norvegicus TaxID=188144 RepID=UPI000C85724A|nr:GTPase [Enterovibrio norvegicus]PML80642.1 hypothetical protein BCT69_10510 [Enterovibrio norvegicus]
MENNSAFSRQLSRYISQSPILDEWKTSSLQLRLHQLNDQPLNILFAGPSGVGKSATINALFATEEFETSGAEDEGAIVRFSSGELVLWDFPGYRLEDTSSAMQLAATLSEYDEAGKPLIDLVVVVLDAAQQNLNDGYQLINKVIAPALGESAEQRMLVMLNKVDAANHSYEWAYVNESCSSEVEIWPESTASLLRHCLLRDAELEVAPVSYAAEFSRKADTMRPYNLLKVMNEILVRLPEEKRLTLLDAPLNQRALNWCDSDNRRNYLTQLENTLFDLVYQDAKDGARFGGLLGAHKGKQGRELGYLLRRQLHASLKIG